LFKKSTLILLFVIFTNNIYSQSIDLDILKNINPTQPNSSFWKGASSSAYPIAIGIQGGLFAYDYLHSDTIKKNAPKVIMQRILFIAVLEGMKYAINRERPYITYPNIIHANDRTEQGKSFPSAHTAITFNTATLLSLRYHKWYITAPAYLWASSVGYSRMYLGDHYPSDVIAGAALGVGSAYLSNFLNKKLVHKGHKQHS
jgi:membrane-associated phospholipid phosphatase